MEIVSLIFWSIYAVTILFVGLSFTLHLDVNKLERGQLFVMVFLGLCPLINTTCLILAMLSSGKTLEELQKELEEIERRNRDKM